jgi:drug/metabolite transporter (DMT)-like permease
LKSIRAKGIAEILLSGFCFGFLGILGKLVYEKGATPGELLSLRFLMASACLWTYFVVRNFSRTKIPIKVVFHCALLGILGYAIFSSFFFHALTGLSASLTVLLLYLYPVMVAVGGWAMFGEKIPRSKWVAIPLAVSGLVALVWGDFQVTKLSALLFGIGAAVFYSVYILASSRLLRGIDPLVSATYIQTFAGLALAATFLRNFDRAQALLVDGWHLYLAIAVVCSVFAMSLFLSGLQKLKSWEASILSLAEPITGVALAMIFLGDRLALGQIFGASAVFTALVFVSLPSSSDRLP